MKKLFQIPDFKEAIFKDWKYLLYNYIPLSYGNALREFTQVEVEGWENVPRTGPCLIIPNHSGIIGWDAVVLQYEILQIKKRLSRTMVHAFWSKNEFLAPMANKLGYIPPDMKNAVKILRKNKLLLLFPEAEEGNFKPSMKMYQLHDFHPGFIALAIMANCPVIPTVILGAEENYINLGTIDWFEKQIGAKIPVPLNLVPLPAKWKIKFLKPVHFSKYSKSELKNHKLVAEMSENIRFRIQSSIHKELVKKGVFKF